LFKVKLKPEPVDTTSKPPAVIGIDLGIKKAVCSVVLTQKGMKHVQFWTQKDKAQQIERYDQMIASLQSKKENLLKQALSADDVTQRLRQLSSKRENISFDYDRKLVKLLSEHVLELSDKYDVYVAIGRLKGIRNRARRGNYTGPRFRGMIHRWAFARITDSLKHKLSMDGFSPKRVFAVPEAWTSIKCHKCGHKGIRPKQSFFLCHTCGYRDNADKNAAINIGRRLIMLIPSLKDENSLKDEKGLGMWLLSHEKAAPKTRRSKRSKRKSSLPKRLPTSSEGKSVADCIQTSLGMFSSTDPAMATTMETPSAAVDTGSHGTTRQRTETKFGMRNSVPMMPGETHAQSAEEVLLVAGDSSHEEG
jgi:IS605 OrfB family transposase